MHSSIRKQTFKTLTSQKKQTSNPHIFSFLVLIVQGTLLTTIVQKNSPLIVDKLRAENIFNELRAKMVDKLRGEPIDWLRGKPHPIRRASPYFPDLIQYKTPLINITS